MLEGLELGIGLEIVRWFQTLRFGLLDNIAVILDFANDGIFYVVIIGAIYWMFNKDLGIRMLFALIISGILTLVLKDIFARPRPYEILYSGIIPLVKESTFGIPSGHSLMTLVIWGYFAIWMKKRSIAIAVTTYIIVQGLSRMYMGVHFPQDVLAGWLLGGIILWSYATQIDRVDIWWRSQSLLIQLGVPIAFGILSMLFFLGNLDGLAFAGLLLGAGGAVVFESRYIHFRHKQSRVHRAVQFILGLVIALAILEGLDIVFDVIEPPTYVYIEENVEEIAALQVQVNLEDGSATDVCMTADESDLDDAMNEACNEQVTPLAAGLRVVRYSMLALFAMSIIPYLSIRLNLMERENTEIKV
jgi:membrane-associated phospholipid phosphatase